MLTLGPILGQILCPNFGPVFGSRIWDPKEKDIGGPKNGSQNGSQNRDQILGLFWDPARPERRPFLETILGFTKMPKRSPGQFCLAVVAVLIQASTGSWQNASGYQPGRNISSGRVYRYGGLRPSRQWVCCMAKAVYENQRFGQAILLHTRADDLQRSNSSAVAATSDICEGLYVGEGGMGIAQRAYRRTST